MCVHVFVCVRARTYAAASRISVTEIMQNLYKVLILKKTIYSDMLLCFKITLIHLPKYVFQLY